MNKNERAQKLINALLQMGFTKEDIIKMLEEPSDASNPPSVTSNASTEQSIDWELRRKISTVLSPLKFSRNINRAHLRPRGYRWIFYAMEICYRNPVYFENLTSLYTKISEKYNVSWRNIHRNIEHAKKLIFKNTPDDILYKYFKGIHSERTGIPTNGQFLTLLTEYLKTH